MARKSRDIFSFFERMIAMDDTAWARHANPLSVCSRMTILPLMTAALLSRAWLGWGAVLPVALVLAWTWWNPRAFRPPAHTESWAAHGTFGERIFLNRAKVPIPAHHSRWAKGLAWASAAGLPFWAWGLWSFDAGLILAGLTLMTGGKLWFVDRMVWLYQDMVKAAPEYAAWNRPKP